jgi:hypothetical protein
MLNQTYLSAVEEVVNGFSNNSLIFTSKDVAHALPREIRNSMPYEQVSHYLRVLFNRPAPSCFNGYGCYSITKDGEGPYVYFRLSTDVQNKVLEMLHEGY